jgi:hypothetical protein
MVRFFTRNQKGIGRAPKMCHLKFYSRMELQLIKSWRLDHKVNPRLSLNLTYKLTLGLRLGIFFIREKKVVRFLKLDISASKKKHK